MSDINRINLTGNLTKDPEVKKTTGGQVAELNVAINGIKKEDTTFITVEAWGKDAEFAAKFLKKGGMVIVEGYLKSFHWKTEEGNRSRVKVVCSQLKSVNTGKKEGKEAEKNPESLESAA